MEKESGVLVCPLLLCVGNCFFQSHCKYSHPFDAVKKSTNEPKQKKALKLSTQGFTPAVTTSSQTDNKAPGQNLPATIPHSDNKVATKSEPENKTGKLKVSAGSFVPTGNQFFEETKNEKHEQYGDYDPEYDEFGLQDEFADFIDDGDGVGDMDEDDQFYFHHNSKNCECCQGFVNNCNGIICQTLGYCHCYAAEIEEERYNEYKHR